MKPPRRVQLDGLITAMLEAPGVRKRTLAAHRRLAAARIRANPTIRVRRVPSICGNTITLKVTAT